MPVKSLNILYQWDIPETTFEPDYMFYINLTEAFRIESTPCWTVYQLSYHVLCLSMAMTYVKRPIAESVYVCDHIIFGYTEKESRPVLFKHRP